eukprot:TRINITY_DN1128_c0_g1_i2.p1 TRINITY_DN1128_c0_g1~~TRINITY_DN1128_c0_g1_i2.p1  ORF type:complete len:648 (+),score=95.55 TRINITY_DN1128_c0_g1_i2:283-2226(+)
MVTRRKAAAEQTNKVSSDRPPSISKTASVNTATPQTKQASSKLIDSRDNVFRLPSAPVFYPSDEEFENPLQYINSIRSEAEKFGICKIVAPSKFREYILKFFNRAIRREDFKFKTKLQNIHQLRSRHGPNDTFNAKLRVFLAHRGITLKPIPRLDGKELDFYKLFNAVTSRGGFHEVTRKRIWKEVSKDLRISSDCTSATYNLSRHYALYLLEYEEFQKKQRRGSADLEVESTLVTTKCEVCNGLEDDEHMLLCDSCNAGFHMYCVSPPLAQIPEGDWYCQFCNDFGFEEGRDFTLPSFENQANSFKRKWFLIKDDSPPSLLPLSSHEKKLQNSAIQYNKPNVNIEPSKVEREYWRIVETSEDQVRVHYGSDVDVETHASGFLRPGHKISGEMALIDKTERDYWTKSRSEGGIGNAIGWDMNLMPRLNDSVLRFISESIPGVTQPMLYIGMLFSSFCWHNEDNYLYSINYLHSGDPKTWYGIPGDASLQFEKAMQEKIVPDLFSKHPDLLHQLITMVSPSTVADHGIPIFTTLQSAGEFVITFPQAYHAGFSHGFNCAESVNFATIDWLPFGRESAERYRHTLRESVFSHQQLLVKAATEENYSQGNSPTFVAHSSSFIILSHEIKNKTKQTTFRTYSDEAARRKRT